LTGVQCTERLSSAELPTKKYKKKLSEAEQIHQWDAGENSLQTVHGKSGIQEAAELILGVRSNVA